MMRSLAKLLGALATLLLIAAYFAWRTLAGPPALAMPERGATLHGVTVIEPGLRRLPNHSVVISGPRIQSVRPTEPAAAPGPYAGHFVIPGLADAHVHFPPSALPGQTQLFAFLFLYHGVTTVRDAGDVDGTASLPARDGVRAGLFPGPRVLACGPFLDGPKPLWKNSIVIHDADEARAAARRVADEGFDCLKGYNQLGPDATRALRDEATKLGLPLIGHVPLSLSYEDARFDDVQHLIGVATPLSIPPPPYPEVMKAWPSTPDARLREIAAFSVAHRIANTPTLVTNERRAAAADYEAIRREADASLLPRFYRDVIWSPREGSLAGTTTRHFEWFREAAPHQRRAVKALFDAGAVVRTGTDVLTPFVVPGASLHRELALFVEAGLTAEQALALSRDTANALAGGRTGFLEAGAPADLLIFRKDPTRDLNGLSSLAAVIADGRLYTRAALDRQLMAYRDAFGSTLYDAITLPLVRRALRGTAAD